MTVEEGLCAFIPCRVHFYHPETQGTFRYGSWIREETKFQSELALERIYNWKRLTRIRQTDTCSLNITDAHRSDTGSYFFTSEPYTKSYGYSYDSSENRLYLQVVGKE